MDRTMGCYALLKDKPNSAPVWSHGARVPFGHVRVPVGVASFGRQRPTRFLSAIGSDPSPSVRGRRVTITLGGR